MIDFFLRLIERALCFVGLHEWHRESSVQYPDRWYCPTCRSVGVYNDQTKKVDVIGKRR